MTLTLKHFDTRNGQWIEYPNPNQQGSGEQPTVILEEKLEKTLLEVFLKQNFPEIDYSNRLSIGHIDEVSTREELSPENHPNGDVLLLSSKSRLIYGPPSLKELINTLNPDPMHNGAYGSIFLGSCSNNYQDVITYLVVDDISGENGGYIDNEQAWKLVGDCHGKVSPQFAQELSSTTNHVLQFRFGNLEDSLYAKGTLAPKNLSEYFKEPEQASNVAFIIPTSSFKGAGKGTVQPGLYTKEIWLGEKERSKQGDISLSQVLASYPEGLRDFIPNLESELDELDQIIQDPRALAKHYCDRYEKRQQQLDKTWKPPTPDEAVGRYRAYMAKGDNNIETENSDVESNYEEFIYLALKADSHNYSLLGTKKFTSSLIEFVRKEYLEGAIGKTNKFDRGMIIPSKDLKTGEICVPWLKEGEKIMQFRSPFLNHNGMIYATNKYVEDIYAPDGKALKGVIRPLAKIFYAIIKGDFFCLN